MTIIHSVHSWVQLSLLSGCGTPGCQVKRLPLLCLLWLTANWLTKTKSLCDYRGSFNVMRAFTPMSMGAINHKKIVHLNFGTLHCAAMCAFCVWWVVWKKKTHKVHKVSFHAFFIDFPFHQITAKTDIEMYSKSVGAWQRFVTISIVTNKMKALIDGFHACISCMCVCVSPYAALVLVGTEGRPGNCYWSGWRIRTLHSWNILH